MLHKTASVAFLLFLTALLHVSCVSSVRQGEVVGVSDGDTITVFRDGQKTVIRLYGIDTPEKRQDFGQKAKQFTSDMVFGKVVAVKTMDTDRYGRTVGIVSMDGKILNEALVEAGYAWVYDTYCTTDVCDRWKKLQSQARSAKRGLWSVPNPVPPWEYRNGKKNDAAVCDCSGNLYDCSDFKTPREAQKCFDFCMDETGSDVHRLDRDKDGRVCGTPKP